MPNQSGGADRLGRLPALAAKLVGEYERQERPSRAQARTEYGYKPYATPTPFAVTQTPSSRNPNLPSANRFAQTRSVGPPNTVRRLHAPDAQVDSLLFSVLNLQLLPSSVCGAQKPELW